MKIEKTIYIRIANHWNNKRSNCKKTYCISYKYNTRNNDMQGISRELKTYIPKILIFDMKNVLTIFEFDFYILNFYF